MTPVFGCCVEGFVHVDVAVKNLRQQADKKRIDVDAAATGIDLYEPVILPAHELCRCHHHDFVQPMRPRKTLNEIYCCMMSRYYYYYQPYEFEVVFHLQDAMIEGADLARETVRIGEYCLRQKLSLFDVISGATIASLVVESVTVSHSAFGVMIVASPVRLPFRSRVVF